MSIKQIILTIHHELPLGVDEETLSHFYEREIRPFIRLFYARQEWSFTHYLCGETLQWLKAYHNEAISAMNELVSRKQMEILGGAYYASFIPLLSPQDRTAQMVEMALALREYFGKKPHGAYLNGDVWEPSLVHSLKTGDLHYTFVDRCRFNASGILSPGELFLTEEMGKTLWVFPFERLNLDAEVDAEVQRILDLPCDGDGLLSLVSDGRDVVALERILNALQAKGVQFTLPSKILTRYKTLSKPIKRVYLPASTGVVFDTKSDFYRNELFNQFSIRLFHAKSIHTALSVRQIKRDKSRKHIAIQSVLRAQNHQFYWHRRYGGFLNAQAREKAMHHLLQADQIVREAEAINYGLVRADFDMDGLDEVLYQSALSNAFVHARGAVLFAWDFFPSGISLLNVFAKDHLAGYSRAFHDFFYPQVFSYRDWNEPIAEPFHAEFAQSVYELVELKMGGNQAKYALEKNIDETLLLLEKEFRFHASYLEVRYVLSNHALGHVSRKFGVELNFSLDASMKCFSKHGELAPDSYEEISYIDMISEEKRIKISISFSHPITLWRKTLTTAFSGREEHQGVAILILLPVELPPASEQRLDIVMRLELFEKDSNLLSAKEIN